MARHVTFRVPVVGIALLAALAGTELARAQSISSLTVTKNAGNDGDVLQTGNSAFQRTDFALCESVLIAYTANRLIR